MLDKTIDSALLNLRRQIIRGNLDGLEHVNALLVQRGLDPAALPKVGKLVVQSKRGVTKRAVIAALGDGPKRPNEIAQHMSQKAGMPYRAAVGRVHQALMRMADSGLVVRDGMVWRLAQ